MEAIDRRQALAKAGGLAAGLGAIGILAAPAEAAAATVRGAWLITPSSLDGRPLGFEAVAAFAAGGVFVTTGSDHAGTGIGQWSSQGSAGFAFTYLNFHFGKGGALSTTVKVRAKGTFRGDTLQGLATLTKVDRAGKPLGASARSVFTGKRVEVEAP